MPGGLLNLVGEGQQNIILNGNPTKSFFKAAYKKYTNFGLQKFRVDYEGSRSLRLNEESSFSFKIPRYADLLMDAFVSVQLPDIWSPILPVGANWVPYEYKWIEYLGAQMISNISITCGGQTIQEYSGAYLMASVERDYSADKKQLFYRMIGHTAEMNNPKHAGSYPNAFYTSNTAGAEPSIQGRTLYIPLNAWFQTKPQMAVPLISLQYNELYVNITMRPVQQLFQIRDAGTAGYPYVAPNFNTSTMQMYRFIQTPPSVAMESSDYVDQRGVWNADIHLICTYAFLSEEESRLFAMHEQQYLFRQVRERVFHNVTGSSKIKIDSLGMVANYMFHLQRSDVQTRNEWSNFTNKISGVATTNTYMIPGQPGSLTYTTTTTTTAPANGFLITGINNPFNNSEILQSMGILLDGSYRENVQPVGIFNYIEKVTKTPGCSPDYLYNYNFCLTTDPHELQPSGAMNMSRFRTIEFELTTILPPTDPSTTQFTSICDPDTGQLIGVVKPPWSIYAYNYDFILFEERYNIVTFVGGNAGLMFAT